MLNEEKQLTRIVERLNMQLNINTKTIETLEADQGRIIAEITKVQKKLEKLKFKRR